MVAASRCSESSGSDSARARLIAALAVAVADNGFRETTVADIVRIARTSRRTFYEHFADREACFLALFADTVRHTMERIAAAVDPTAPWEAQVDAAIDAYIDGVQADPQLQMSFVRELPGLGEAGAQRQLAVIERFAALLVGLVESGRREQPGLTARSLSRDTAIMIVGGLRELAVIALQQNRPLGSLRAPASQTVKAILRGTLLADGEPAVAALG